MRLRHLSTAKLHVLVKVLQTEKPKTPLLSRGGVDALKAQTGWCWYRDRLKSVPPYSSTPPRPSATWAAHIPWIRQESSVILFPIPFLSSKRFENPRPCQGFSVTSKKYGNNETSLYEAGILTYGTRRNPI